MNTSSHAPTRFNLDQHVSTIINSPLVPFAPRAPHWSINDEEAFQLQYLEIVAPEWADYLAAGGHAELGEWVVGTCATCLDRHTSSWPHKGIRPSIAPDRWAGNIIHLTDYSADWAEEDSCEAAA